MINESAAPYYVQTFMTHRMSNASIRTLATGREKETELIKSAVKRSLDAAPGALQHVVIYGPRGFGKSFMARLIQIESADFTKPNAPIPFVLLPEEQQNLTRNPHALPAYIAHRLADLRTGEDHSWTDAMFQWPEPDKEAWRWDETTAQLERELDLSLPKDRGMAIVVIENFDFLLAKVFKDTAAEQRLRKWLDRPKNRLMLIATATGSVDMDYDRPLFQAFQPVRLEPWSQDTCITYFNRRRKADGKLLLDAATEAKARAVADFIGGNPRLAQLLADVLETQDALSVADTMNALVDKLAEYYGQRINDLPPLAQGLLDALIRGGEPASQTELAQRVGAKGQNTIARVMQDLLRADIIRGLAAMDGRETLYRITDRVFAHFYRLRQGNQLALRSPLATILDFLRTFYSHDELKAQAEFHLKAGRFNEAQVFADLVRNGELTTQTLDFVSRARSLYQLGQHKEAAVMAYKAAVLAEENKYKEAIAMANKAGALADRIGEVSLQARMLVLVAVLSGLKGHYEEASVMARKAAALADQAKDNEVWVLALKLAISLLDQLGKYEEVLTTALPIFDFAQLLPSDIEIQREAVIAIRAAAHVPSSETVYAFARWLDWSVKSSQNGEDSSWEVWLNDWFAAAARVGAWDALDELIENHANRLTGRGMSDWFAVGVAIARTAEAEGRAAGFEAARGILPRFVFLWRRMLRHSETSANYPLHSLVSGFAACCHDPELIRDVAELLTSELSLEAPEQAALLLVLAQLDEAKNPQAILARTDPDIALWLRLIRDLPEPSEKPRRRKTRSR